MAMMKDIIGKYKIVSKIGEGGMGKVYKAFHPTLKKHIIIKQLTITKKILAERFKREAHIMISFSHENIVPVYDHFKEGASYFIAMEFVEGLSLEGLIKKKKTISPLATILIFREVCKGLKYAHDKSAVHRDIKPDNVLISKNGEVKLTDFGIATMDTGKDEGLTKTGMVMGTPSYMSPEQLSDTKSVDKRSDIYSMGVMFYQMITGKKPFSGSFTAESISSINRGIYVKPKKINPSIPRVFKKIIKKTMNCKIKKRYKDLQYLIDFLDKFTKKKFKNQNDIHKAIKSYINEPDNIEISAFQSIKAQKNKLQSIALAVGIGLLSVTAIVGAVIFTNTHYELLLARDYGCLKIKTSLPGDYYKNPGNVYVRACLTFLDVEEGEEKIEYKYILSHEGDNILDMFLKKEEEGEKDNFYSSGSIYLRAGNYQLELEIENKKYFKTFYLNPRAIQKKTLDSNSLDKDKKRIIYYNSAKAYSKQITIVPLIKDSQTGKSLYSIADLAIKIGNGKWLDWKIYNEKYKDYMDSHIVSGKTYSFSVRATSYYSQVASFTVERDRDTVLLEVNLVKIPGKLVVNSSYKGLRILIDNRSENYIGGKTKKFVNFKKTIEGKSEFYLQEGEYVLTIGNNNNERKNYEFIIKSDTTKRINISYDIKDKVISIK